MKKPKSLRPPEIYRNLSIGRAVGATSVSQAEIARAVNATFVENQLSEERVNEFFSYCLAAKNSRAKTVSVESWSQTAKFLTSRLKELEFDIRQMLQSLPDSFQSGGYSLKFAGKDRYGRVWTESHKTIEKLFLMGIALGFAKHVFPQSQWKDLPSGMPYYLVTK